MGTNRSVLRANIRLKIKEASADIWEDSEINTQINQALRGLWPEVYKRITTAIGTTSTSALEYTLDAAVERIGKVEVEDSDGNYQEVLRWEEETNAFGGSYANKLIFEKLPRENGMTIRVTYREKFTDFSGDTAADFPSYLDEAVEVKACALLLQKLVAERAKFIQISGDPRKDAASMAELIAAHDKFQDRFDALLDQHRMPPILSMRYHRYGITEGVQPVHSGRSRRGVSEPETE